jgi:hypothetical protein
MDKLPYRGPLDIPSTMPPNGLILDGADYSARTFDYRSEEDCLRLDGCMTMFNRFQDPDSKIFWGTRFDSASSHPESNASVTGGFRWALPQL